jgi:hypothetical protein
MAALIVAFLSEFTASEKEKLGIKTFGSSNENIQERRKIVKLVKDLRKTLNVRNAPEVILVQDLLEYRTFLSLLRRMNVYCTASRGESKNISMLMAAAIGKQCIYIDTTANKDFASLSSTLMYPIRFGYEPCTNMGNIYCTSDIWARPDVVHLQLMMRKAFIDYKTKDFKGDRQELRDNVSAIFSPKVVAEQFATNYRLAVGERNVVTL